MSPTYTDEAGNPVEFPLSPDEVEALQKEKDEYVEKANKVEGLEKLVQEKDDELAKLGAKDFNFSALRKASKEEKEKILADYSEKEKAFINELGDLKATVESNQISSLKDYEEEVVGAMAGSDEDLKTKIKETAKMFVGEASTKSEMFARYKNAYTLIKESAPNINPVNQFVPTTTPVNEHGGGKKKDWTETDEGKASYGKFFPDTVKKKD